MQTTNKKFFDKKNIAENQDANIKNTFQKKSTQNINFSQFNEFNTKDNYFSKPYEHQDQYAEISNQFEAGKFDIGYQTFENAFPFKRKHDFNSLFSDTKDFNINNLNNLFNEINPQKQLRQFQLPQLPQHQMQFQNLKICMDSDSQNQQILDQQQSTQDNSNPPKQENE